MPGEKVTMRLESSEKEIFTDVICYPRPLIIQKANGETLLEAELLKQMLQRCVLKISEIGANEKYYFLSTSGNEKMKHILDILRNLLLPAKIALFPPFWFSAVAAYFLSMSRSRESKG